ncbi:MAG TPA: dTDP-4-dehydrorhamnose reductase [Chthonomonadales bacterium]|nr:dTDP-4-dehydrorhamnose reductase [Chthonomonadales bacterium]
MRVLVTGANGMLGTDLCEMLETAGHEVVRTDIAARPEVDCADWLPLDITDIGAVRAILTETRPDCVIHTAAYTDVDGCERQPDRAFQANTLGTWCVASVCAARDILLVYISTDFVFDGTKTAPYTELDRPNPINHYGASKLGGEWFVSQLCRRYFVARTAWLYGTEGRCFPGRMIEFARSKTEINVVADQFGSPTYTRDLAAAAIELLDCSNFGIYHIVNSGSCSWAELAARTLELAGIRTMRIQPIPASEYPSPTRRPVNSVLRRYALELQNRDNMRPWHDALKDYVERLRRA